MADNSRAINRVFTRGVINDLLQNGTNEVYDYVVREYISDPENKTHREIISEIYAYLGKQKRNEYYYMNTLLNKLLVGIHSVNTTTALSQVRIGHHIADFIMINGEGRVYEIKSDLDNFDRLTDQLRDYFKAFSKVSVLTSLPSDFEKVLVWLDKLGDMGEAVGIYHMNDDDIYFSRDNRREPQQFDDYLDYTCIFKLLRKNEYESIISCYFGELPQVAPVFYFKACLEYFQKIPILIAQDLTYKKLKERNKITKIKFETIPWELKSVIYFSGLSNKLSDIEKWLITNYRG
jgi:hypothetical protein